jgi:CMP-N-acetylneuraminic acid synthetase
MAEPRRPDDVTVFVNARLASRRCPMKMVRPFAGTTLVEIALEKIGQLGWPRTWFGAYEEELLAPARRYPGIRVYRRSRESALSDSDPRRVFEILREIDTRWVMWINPCAPLVSADTFRAALDAFLAGRATSMTSVRPLGGWFYSVDGTLLNDTGGNVDTMLAQPILQVAHAFHIYPRERMLADGRPWPPARPGAAPARPRAVPDTPGDPELYRIPEAEAHDIDTEDEFETVEYLYRRRMHG